MGNQMSTEEALRVITREFDRFMRESRRFGSTVTIQRFGSWLEGTDVDTREVNLSVEPLPPIKTAEDFRRDYAAATTRDDKLAIKKNAIRAINFAIMRQDIEDAQALVKLTDNMRVYESPSNQE